jgi:hypothetical protein
MKYLKILGLAAVAAMAVMAFVGASTASAADVLCENNTSTPCNAKVATNGVITAEAKDPILTASPQVTCESSTVSLKVTNNTGLTNPTGEITALNWTGCKTTTGIITSCTVTTQNLPFHAEVTTPGPNLTVKPHSGGGNPGANVVCGGFLSCTFSNTDFTLPIVSGNPAHVTASEVELKLLSGAFCPSTAKWDATYVAESPTQSIFVKSS